MDHEAQAKEMKKIAQEMHARMRWYAESGVDIWKRAPFSPFSPSKSALSPEETSPSKPIQIVPSFSTKGSAEVVALHGVAPTLEMVREEIGDCQRCPLCSTRKNIVFGTGDPHASLLFVGEAPGEDEDLKAEPFVGRAGQLLTKMIIAMGLSRETVYIANIIKCRPPKNRNPAPEEIAACQPFLLKQIQAIRPKVICALGTFSAQTLLSTQQKISALRGQFHDFHGIKVLPTFHPAYLLRNPNEKKRVWEDLQKIMEELKK
jgi:DNA polymerase